MLSSPVLLPFMLQVPQASHTGPVAPFSEEFRCRIPEEDDPKKAKTYFQLSFVIVSTSNEPSYDVWLEGVTIQGRVSIGTVHYFPSKGID